MNTLFLSYSTKRLLSAKVMPIKTVAIIGFGQMGQGIAQCCASGREFYLMN